VLLARPVPVVNTIALLSVVTFETWSRFAIGVRALASITPTIANAARGAHHRGNDLAIRLNSHQCAERLNPARKLFRSVNGSMIMRARPEALADFASPPPSLPQNVQRQPARRTFAAPFLPRRDPLASPPSRRLLSTRNSSARKYRIAIAFSLLRNRLEQFTILFRNPIGFPIRVTSSGGIFQSLVAISRHDGPAT